MLSTRTTPGSIYDRFRWAQDLLAHRDPNAAYGILSELHDEVETSKGDDAATLSAIRAELTLAAFHSARLDIAIDLARESLADDPTDVDALVLLVRGLQRLARMPEAKMALRRLEAIAGADAPIVTDLQERMR